MKFYKILFLFLISSKLHAFFLLSSPVPEYQVDEIPIRVITNNCTNAQVSNGELKTLIQEAIDDYWNTVGTSRIKLIVGEDITLDPDLTLNEMINFASANEIIIGCTTDNTDFSSDTTLAVGGISGANGITRGVVAVNNTATTAFNSISALNQKATMAHEIGHALGIGHSNLPYALMYFSISEAVIQEHLAEDDVDAITYLYPHDAKLGGLMGSCGTISLNGKNNVQKNIFSFLSSILLGLLLIKLFFRVPKLLGPT